MGTDITEESRTQFHSTNSPSQPFQISIMTSFVGHNKGLIDFDQKSLAVAAASIAFNPIFWNTVARQEYHNKILTKLAGGNSRMACYGLAVTIFSLGIFPTCYTNEPCAPNLAIPSSRPPLQHTSRTASSPQAMSSSCLPCGRSASRAHTSVITLAF